MFRGVPAQWFEQLIAKPMLARAVETLATTRAVEFDFVSDETPALELSDLRTRLTPYYETIQRYRHYLPAPVWPGPVTAERLEAVIDRNLERLASWQGAASPRVAELERLLGEAWQLDEFVQFLRLASGAQFEPGSLREVAPTLEYRLFVSPGETETPEAIRKITHMRVENEHVVYLLTLGTSQQCEEAERTLARMDGHQIDIPAWIDGDMAEALCVAESKRQDIEESIAGVRHELAGIDDANNVGEALGEFRRLEWLVDKLEGVPVGEYFARLTGWTSDADGRLIRSALEKSDLPTVVFLTEHPEDKVPPILVRNPFWARPFEFFGRLMGTPAASEAEPSLLIAVVAPLLFGYMFGDVGHGLVILVLGLLLRKRWPPMAMLISGGVVAIGFGFLYGSIFSFEHVIPALWMNPFDAPLTVLFLPMLLGALLIVLGMVLNGLGHLWEGRLGFWLRNEAGVLLAYVMLGLSVMDSDYLFGVLAGLLWYFAGNLWSDRNKGIGALGSAVGEFFEYALQLMVNTVSFVRVGAFALAHAGLGATVYSLASSSEHLLTTILVLLVGNITIIALEGLVVSVQTTRLLLFEFFIRFMKAGGRPFKPLEPPVYAIDAVGKERA